MDNKTSQTVQILKYLAISCAGGGAAALLWMVTSVGGLLGLFMVFVSLPLLMVGLSIGVGGVLVASSIAALLVNQGSIFLLGQDPQVLPYVMVGFLLQVAIPVIVLSWMAVAHKTAPAGAKAWYPVGSILSWLSVIGVVAVGAMWLTSYYVLGEGLAASIDRFLSEKTPLIQEAMSSSGAMLPADRLLDMLDMLKKFMPSLLVISVWLGVIVNSILAQYFLSLFKVNLRPSPRMADVYAPTWIIMTMGVCGVVALFTKGEIGFMATNIAIVLSLPMLFAGLGVVHAYAATKKAGIWLLVIFYVLSAMFAKVIILLTVGLGIIDEWLHIRKKFVQQLDKK